MDYTPEILEEKFDALPDDVKNVLSSEQTSKVLDDIGTQNGLLEDRIEILVNETGFVLLGLSHPSQFVSNLATNMGISRENAEHIAKAVNEAVFAPIRESLKKIHHIGTPNSMPQGADTQKKIDITPDPASVPHADKLEKVTIRPPEEIHAVDQTKKNERPFSLGGDPYREPV